MDNVEIRSIVESEMEAAANDIEFLTWLEAWEMSEEEAEYAQSLVDEAKVSIELAEEEN